MSPRKGAPSIEYSLLLTATLCLLAFGVVMVFSASFPAAGTYYFLRQLTWVGLGGVVFIGVAAGVIAAAGLMSIRPAPRDGATGRPDAGGRQGDRISAATRADRMENHTPEG